MEVTKSQEQQQHKYPSVIDRYFKKKYYLFEDRQKEAFCILVHSNRICIVTLGETHPILSKNKCIRSVSFTIGDVNRLDNKVSGKAKRGAQTLTATSPLCEITCDDGEKFVVPAGMKGQLIEVNEQLLNNPSLLTLKAFLPLVSRR
ncbi:hypothetical protein CHS0354_019707 [Potamilus streckersoni]|uniref:Actin-binding transcription modulator n=1 Tax=Potamilus streckersoni TaxID=2493646 RepID=A0AAE0S9Y3_9BIVA|nr:hypothetical protein CHS0354_019707 [Potamilus streckersoni]